MVHVCVVPGCSNRSDREKNLSFHCLPLKNKILLRTWIHKIGRKNLPLNNNSYMQARRKQFTCGPASFKSECGANYARKTRGVWGQGKFCNLPPQKLLLMAFETTFTGQYLDFVVWPKSQLRFSETENF